MSEILFKNSMVAIFVDGSYKMAPKLPGKILWGREPSNRDRVGRAAHARELGLDIPEIPLEWTPEPGVAMAPREEIEDRVRRHFAALECKLVNIGRPPVRWELNHDCTCPRGECYCPSHPVEWAKEDRFEWRWVSSDPVPDSWLSPGGSRIRVQTDDSRSYLDQSVLEPRSVSLLSVNAAIKCNVPQLVIDKLAELHLAWEAKWEANNADRVRAQREAYAKEFGVIL